jgi:integral membrane sensor domain MASE1
MAPMRYLTSSRDSPIGVAIRSKGGVRISARFVIELLAIGIIYFVAATLGLSLASINPSATPIWPPTGFALAAVLLRGYRVCPAIFLAALLANEVTAGSLSTSAAIALGNTLECFVGGFLINRWSDGQATLRNTLR